MSRPALAWRVVRLLYGGADEVVEVAGIETRARATELRRELEADGLSYRVRRVSLDAFGQARCPNPVCLTLVKDGRFCRDCECNWAGT